MTAPTIACVHGDHDRCRSFLGGRNNVDGVTVRGVVLDAAFDSGLDSSSPFYWRPVALCACACHVPGDQREGSSLLRAGLELRAVLEAHGRTP